MKGKWVFIFPAILALLLFSVHARAKKKGPENTPDACMDKEDNDQDSFIDCDDQDCAALVFCQKEEKPEEPPPPEPVPITHESTKELCRDSEDNDGDGFMDCDDQDCEIFAFCLEKSKAPGPAEAEAEAPKEPRISEGGIGVYLSTVVFGKAAVQGEYSGDTSYEEVKIKPHVGIGLFGESLVTPYVGLGGEIYLAFPTADEVRLRFEGYSWSEWDSCDSCKTNVLFSAMFRLRFPIPAGKWIAICPMLSVGFADWARRGDGVDTANHIGLIYMPGLGMEIRTPTIMTPFLDVRYVGGVGWALDAEHPMRLGPKFDQRALMHSVVLNFGFRML